MLKLENDCYRKYNGYLFNILLIYIYHDIDISYDYYFKTIILCSTRLDVVRQ